MNIPPSDAGGDFQALVAARRNFTLRRLHAPGPDAPTLARIVEAAAHAPDHGLLRPWRFVLIPQQRRADLGEVFAEALAERAVRARWSLADGSCLTIELNLSDKAVPVDEAPRGELLHSSDASATPTRQDGTLAAHSALVWLEKKA